MLIRLKVLPTDASIKPDQLSNNIGKKLSSNMKMKNSRAEPIAFGLEALIADFIVPDEEGMVDMLEETVNSVKFVSQIEVLGMSRR